MTGLSDNLKAPSNDQDLSRHRLVQLEIVFAHSSWLTTAIETDEISFDWSEETCLISRKREY